MRLRSSLPTLSCAPCLVPLSLCSLRTCKSSLLNTSHSAGLMTDGQVRATRYPLGIRSSRLPRVSLYPIYRSLLQVRRPDPSQVQVLRRSRKADERHHRCQDG
jgi:hypothetical protein